MCGLPYGSFSQARRPGLGVVDTTGCIIYRCMMCGMGIGVWLVASVIACVCAACNVNIYIMYKGGSTLLGRYY